MAGVSVQEFGEQSPLRVARSRLPWLLGGLGGQIGAILVLQRFEESLTSMVALSFFIPVMMAMAGNVGIQTSSVVVRGLATGEVDFFHLGRHLLRELVTNLLIGFEIGISLFLICGVVVGDLRLAWVLFLSMLIVIVLAAAVGTGVPLLLHRFGADPAVATGPFITTANDIFGLLVYLGLATLILELGGVVAS
jgi:magnesium transporter